MFNPKPRLCYVRCSIPCLALPLQSQGQKKCWAKVGTHIYDTVYIWLDGSTFNDLLYTVAACINYLLYAVAGSSSALLVRLTGSDIITSVSTTPTTCLL